MSEITVSRTKRHKCTNISPWKYTKWQHKLPIYDNYRPFMVSYSTK